MYDLVDIPRNYTNPAIEYIRHRDRYTIKGKRKGYHIANGYTWEIQILFTDSKS